MSKLDSQALKVYDEENARRLAFEIAFNGIFRKSKKSPLDCMLKDNGVVFGGDWVKYHAGTDENGYHVLYAVAGGTWVSIHEVRKAFQAIQRDISND